MLLDSAHCLKAVLVDFGGELCGTPDPRIFHPAAGMRAAIYPGLPETLALLRKLAP